MEYQYQHEVLDFLNDGAPCPVCEAPMKEMTVKTSIPYASVMFECGTVTKLRQSAESKDQPWVVDEVSETTLCLHRKIDLMQVGLDDAVPIKMVK